MLWRAISKMTQELLDKANLLSAKINSIKENIGQIDGSADALFCITAKNGSISVTITDRFNSTHVIDASNEVKKVVLRARNDIRNVLFNELRKCEDELANL